jgi:hypothetical protein
MADPGGDDDPWRTHRADQERRWAEATPQQRFAWLEQAWLFAWQARRAAAKTPTAPEPVN